MESNRWLRIAMGTFSMLRYPGFQNYAFSNSQRAIQASSQSISPLVQIMTTTEEGLSPELWPCERNELIQVSGARTDGCNLLPIS